MCPTFQLMGKSETQLMPECQLTLCPADPGIQHPGHVTASLSSSFNSLLTLTDGVAVSYQ